MHLSGIIVRTILAIGAVSSSVWFINSYYSNYLLRCEKYEEAVYFLERDVCANPVHKARLNEHNLCTPSQRTVNKGIYFAAFYDVFQDMSVCKEGRCSVAGIELNGPLGTVFRYSLYVFLVAFAFAVHSIITTSYYNYMIKSQLPLYEMQNKRN